MKRSDSPKATATSAATGSRSTRVPSRSPTRESTRDRADSEQFAGRWWVTLLAVATIAAAGIVVYLNSFSGVFLFDDPFWIHKNPSIKQLWPPWLLLYPEVNGGMVGGRPVVSLTLALNYFFGETNVWGYHAVNLAIHILSALTLFGLVRQTLTLPSLRDRFGSAATAIALATALIWTVHPLQTGAVTYIIQRNESLVGLFYLLTMYCAVRGATAGAGVRGQGPGAREESGETGAEPFPHASRLKPPLWYSAAVLSCLFGMATKEVMATVPLVVLLYDRTFLSGSFRRAISDRWGLYLAFAATYGAIAWGLISTGFHDNTTGFANKDFTPWSYLLTQPGVLMHYLRLTFWPTGQCLDYAWPAAIWPAEIVWPGLAIISLLGLTAWALVRRPALGFLGAWFFLILAPTSSIVPIRDAAFEHRMYLPLAAVVTLVVVGCYELWDCFHASRAAAGHGRRRAANTAGPITLPTVAMGALLAAIVSVLGGATFVRNKVYQSPIDMWTDIVLKAPNNARGHQNLAKEFLSRGSREGDEAAIKEARIAVEIDPQYIEAYANLSLALINVGKLDDARQVLDKACDVNPHFAALYCNMGLVFGKRKQYSESIRCFQTALTIDPKNLQAQHNLALAYLSARDYGEAITEYRKAIELDSQFAEAHHGLGVAFASLNRFDEAAPELRSAVDLRPDDAEFHFDFGHCLVTQGNVRDAVSQFRTAARLPSNNILFLNRAATLLATYPDPRVRNGEDAVKLANAAVGLTNGRDPGCLAALAAAYAETGRFAAAVQLVKQAIGLVNADRNPALANQIREQIQRYQANVSVPEPPVR